MTRVPNSSMLRRSLSCGSVPALVPGHRGPDEPDEFARDRCHGDGRALAVADEMAVTAMQALLRAPRLSDDLGRLPLATARQRAPDGGPMAIVPGGLDENSPRVTVPGFGQGAAALVSPEEYSLGTSPR